MTARHIIAPLLAVSGAVLLSCRFEDRTPGSSRREDVALQAATVSFYRALADRDTLALQEAALPAATVLVASEGGGAALVPLHTMIVVGERRNLNGGARVVRTELHADGDIATDHVVVIARGEPGGEDYEASDWITMARRDGAWRVAHAVFGPWRKRTAQ